MAQCAVVSILEQIRVDDAGVIWHGFFSLVFHGSIFVLFFLCGFHMLTICGQQF